ncbi:MAG: hypothetical protein LBB36_07165 [Fibromonadaceae bacterium]|jgi:hypothetical protein|nr:hypothetical protein [Fibromonadaceae bacterium]
MRTNSTRKGVARYAPTIRSLARLWLATLLIFNACSNGSSGGGGNIGGSGGYEGDMVACKYMEIFYMPIKGKESGYVCVEVPLNNIQGGIAYAKADCEDFNGQFYNNGCPNGYEIKCPGTSGDGTINYLYGNEFIGVTCNEFFNAW